VTSSGQVAATSFWTYAGTSSVKWGSSAIGSAGGNVSYGPSNWTPTEQSALLSGLALWSAEANISFSAAASQASANFVFYRGNDGSAYEDDNRSSVAVGSTHTGSFIGQAVISIDTSQPGFGPITNNLTTYGRYPYETLVHEEGHLIGLGHGGPYNGSVNTSTQQFSAYDTRLWTLMSYINPWDTSAKYYASYPVSGTSWGSIGGSRYEATTPMILDILAAQELYGPATSGPLTISQTFGFNTTITGSIARYFDFNTNTNPVITIWDSAAQSGASRQWGRRKRICRGRATVVGDYKADGLSRKDLAN
jgi:serralysin